MGGAVGAAGAAAAAAAAAGGSICEGAMMMLVVGYTSHISSINRSYIDGMRRQSTMRGDLVYLDPSPKRYTCSDLNRFGLRTHLQGFLRSRQGTPLGWLWALGISGDCKVPVPVPALVSVGTYLTVLYTAISNGGWLPFP